MVEVSLFLENKGDGEEYGWNPIVLSLQAVPRIGESIYLSVEYKIGGGEVQFCVIDVIHQLDIDSPDGNIFVVAEGIKFVDFDSWLEPSEQWWSGEG